MTGTTAPPVAGSLLARGPLQAMVAAVASLTASALPAFLLGALGIQITDDLGLSKTQLGIAIAAFYLVSAIGSLHAGALADWIGPHRSLLLANVVSAACLLAVATLANGFPILLVTMLFGSVGLMISGPATKVLVARGVPAARQGLAFGIQMSAIPLAALLGGLAVPTIGLTVGWRWAFAGAALIPLLGIVTLPPERAGRDSSAPRPAGLGHVDFRPLAVLGTAAVLGAAAATTMASFFVVTGTAAGFSEAAAGVMLSVVSGLVIVLRIAFGRVADRWESAHPYAVAGLFVVATVGYLLLVLGSKALFPIGAFLALSCGWAWTGLLVYTVVLHHPAAPGLASSVIVGGMNLGSVVGPLGFGLAIERLEDSAAFAVIGAGTLLAAGASRLGLERLSRAAQPATNRAVTAPTLGSGGTTSQR
jgi:predicted MFS family arabinose efflux permease